MFERHETAKAKNQERARAREGIDQKRIHLCSKKTVLNSNETRLRSLLVKEGEQKNRERGENEEQEEKEWQASD